MYERNEKLYKHKISQMQKVIPSFQYESLILILEFKNSYEEYEIGNINGARPLRTIIEKKELVNLRARKDNY
jgi:hypothetical protein